MRKRILAGASLGAALAVGPAAAPALADPAPAATACEVKLFADEVTVRDLGTEGLAADGWSIQCSADRHVKVKIDYVIGRTVVSETDVAAGDQWQALDLTPSTDGSGVNAVVSVYEGDELLTQEAINWD